MHRSRGSFRAIVLGGLSALAFAAGGAPSPASALPIASGSKCSSDWVNNAGAMSCFTKGEEEARSGVRRPHYVACVGGDVFCCVDNDHGAQDCTAQARGGRASQADWIRAILGANKTMLMRMGRFSGRPGAPRSEIPGAPTQRTP